MTSVHFDEAGQKVAAFAADLFRARGLRSTVIRDIRGLLRLVVDDREAPLSDHDVSAFAAALHLLAGPWVPPDDAAIAAHEFSEADALLAGARPIAEGVRWIERTLLAWDWSPETPPAFAQSPPRLVFYGIKGGVGRSTAAAVTAIDLARRGKRVLVVDLDLESPGIGALLAPSGGAAAGVVDWLVEDLVGNADSDLVASMVHRVSLPEVVAGEVFVAPAKARGGDAPDTYLQKLARAYQAAPRGGALRPFSQRIAEMIGAIERETRAEVTIVDSRAGLHEIGAATMVGLGGTCLLFAMDSPQTWEGYALLFEAWAATRATLQELRENVAVVAALVPEAGDKGYVEALRGHAYDLFAEHLYDEQTDGADEGFNYALDADDAPHAPLEVHWNRRLLEFSPVAGPWSPEVRAAYEPFLDGLRRRKIVPP